MPPTTSPGHCRRRPATRVGRVRRAAIVGIVAGAVVVVAAGAGVAWWLLRGETADQAAQRYVQALEEGDRAALEKLLPDDADHAQALDLFDGAAGRISDAQLSAAGDDDSFRADVMIDGQPGVVHFSLAQDSGPWLLAADYLGTLEVTTTIGGVTPGAAVEIGGVTVPVGQTQLFPAVYTVHAAPADILAGEATVAVTNEAPVTVMLEASLTPEATALAQEQVDAYAGACAQPATAVPPHCGLRVPWGADLTALSSLDFRVEKTPQVALAADATTFAATGGAIVATARGTARSGGDGTFTYRADDWALYGDVSFEDDQMVLAVR